MQCTRSVGKSQASASKEEDVHSSRYWEHPRRQTGEQSRCKSSASLPFSFITTCIKVRLVTGILALSVVETPPRCFEHCCILRPGHLSIVLDWANDAPVSVCTGSQFSCLAIIDLWR